MADAEISYEDANEYWSSVPPTIDSVLGGFGNSVVPKVDVVGSTAFIRRLGVLSPSTFPNGPAEGYEKVVLDVASGIGRVARDLLSKYATTIDILEQAKPLISQARLELAHLPTGTFYEQGMQHFECDKTYWLIWCQWCLGHLPDDALVKFLSKCRSHLQPGGVIIIKENNGPIEDMFDETDSSVTRTDSSFRNIFERAGLRLLLTSLQKGMPRELFPVRMYALAPAQKAAAEVAL